jgi:hypothetical protein
MLLKNNLIDKNKIIILTFLPEYCIYIHLDLVAVTVVVLGIVLPQNWEAILLLQLLLPLHNIHNNSPRQLHSKQQDRFWGPSSFSSFASSSFLR